MNFIPFFIFKLLFILQFFFYQIFAENEFITFQIIANDLAEQPPPWPFPNGDGRFQLNLVKYNEENNEWEDICRLTDSKDSFYIKRMPPMQFQYSVIIMADGRKTKYKQFEITEMTSPIYSIILKDAPLPEGIKAQKYKIDSQIYNKKLEFSANIYDGTELDTLPIIEYLTPDQLDLIKQKIPETLHSSVFDKLNEKNSFMFPQIKIWRQENQYNIDIGEGESIQRIEKRQPISLPIAHVPPVPMPTLPLKNFALAKIRNPAAKKGKKTIRNSLPSSPLKPKKLEKSSEPKPIDLDFLVTPPMSPKNSGVENMTMTNLDIPLNTINLDNPPTPPISENSPINSDITMNIENDKTRLLLLAKGKRPLENGDAGTSNIRINGRNLKFVELNKIITAPKRKRAEIYENGNSMPLNNFDGENLKWGKQQKRGSNWEKIRNKLGNLEIDGGNGKSHHQKSEKILYVENEPKSPMNIDEEEEEGIGHKSGMKKFVKSLLRTHQVEMKNNIKDGGIFNSKGFDDDLIYFHDDKKSKL